MVEIEDDVGNVARDLREIDPHLRLRYSEAGGYFVVYFKRDSDELGDGYVVTTAEECDQRIVSRVREISSEGYDYAAELERLDKEAKAKQDYEAEQRIGEVGEKLHHAFRKDFGKTDRAAFISKEKK